MACLCTGFCWPRLGFGDGTIPNCRGSLVASFVNCAGWRHPAVSRCAPTHREAAAAASASARTTSRVGVWAECRWVGVGGRGTTSGWRRVRCRMGATLSGLCKATQTQHFGCSSLLANT